jgi:hypothetical protein
MDNNSKNTKTNINIENQYNWLHTILSIHKIGGLLTSIIAIAPAILILLPFYLFFPKNEEEYIVLQFLLMALTLALVLIGTWWWLNYLERKINLAILLPIPLIKIPLKWILYPFMLPFFGIIKIYRHFSPERSINNIDSLDNLESESEL